MSRVSGSQVSGPDFRLCPGLSMSFLYIQDLISAGDNVCFISNKRCLRSSKKLHKMGLKKYLMNRSIPFFSNIFGMMADVSLVREAILFLSKSEAGCFQSEYK